LSTLGQEPYPDNVYFQADGFKLSYLEAYKHRGPILAHLCFYDYASFVFLKKERHHGSDPASIPFLPTAIVCKGWIQCLRTAQRTAVPIFHGHLTDEFDKRDERFVKR
jgi:hypothetical protein